MAPGRNDMIIPTKHSLVVMEWKTVQLDYLELGKVDGTSKFGNRESRARKLAAMGSKRVLALRRNKLDEIHGPGVGTIRDWLKGEVAGQLRGAVLSEEITRLARKERLRIRAYIVAVVGSRRIIVWEMDGRGKLKDEPTVLGGTDEADLC